MKKEWNKPELEILDVNMTMQGPGLRYVDKEYQDQDEKGALHYS